MPLHALTVVGQPPADYYKDEGGKGNHFSIRIGLKSEKAARVLSREEFQALGLPARYVVVDNC